MAKARAQKGAIKRNAAKSAGSAKGNWKKDLLDPKSLRSVLTEAIFNSNMGLLRDVIISQVQLSNKVDLIKKSKIGRQTLYDLIDKKRSFNPRTKTLSSLMKVMVD